MSLVHEDGKNLNREFPSKEDGSVSACICRTIEKELFSKADYYIDLHCGDGYEELHPYVYYVGLVKESVKETALEMARQTSVDYIVESHVTAGGAYKLCEFPWNSQHSSGERRKRPVEPGRSPGR